jgi:hypothetical protein
MSRVSKVLLRVKMLSDCLYCYAVILRTQRDSVTKDRFVCAFPFA